MTGLPSIRRNPLRVLVVEDDIDMADSLGTLLRLWGYKVRVCYECSEALEIVGGFGPQVALLDHGLLGMDSYELVRRLRGPAGACQVVLVAGTGYRSDADRRRAKAAGCDFRLTTPVDPE